MDWNLDSFSWTRVGVICVWSLFAMLMTKDCLVIAFPPLFWWLEIIHFYRHFLFISFAVCWCLFGLVWLFLSHALLFSLIYLGRTYWAAPACFALRWVTVTRLAECLFQEKPVASAFAAARDCVVSVTHIQTKVMDLHSWDIVSHLFSRVGNWGGWG